jgi:hypothetical protein
VLRAWLALSLLCAACTADPPLAFPVGTVLLVSVLSGTGSPKTWNLWPTDPSYAKIQDWLSHNQSGWSNYLSTPPAFGILVSGGELRLQFVEKGVLACRPGGCIYKSTSESEYGFLAR